MDTTPPLPDRLITLYRLDSCTNNKINYVKVFTPLPFSNMSTDVMLSFETGNTTDEERIEMKNMQITKVSRN